MEQNITPPIELERNQETRAAHRREVFWQIFFPLGIGFILVVGLFVGMGLAGVGDASLWADVSLIWILIPLIILAIFPLVILVGLIYGVTFLTVKLPYYAFIAQQAFKRLAAMARYWSDRAVDPLLKIHSNLAALRTLRRR
jgi:hypothetical protein